MNRMHQALAEKSDRTWSIPDTGVDWKLTRKRDRSLDDGIVRCVHEGDRVLDLGCGVGDLLARLRRERRIVERGVELESDAATEAISRGFSVVHGDLEEALFSQGDKTYDVVVLNQVIQTVGDTVSVLEESVRVGNTVVVTFPNFAHWVNRFRLLWSGRLPVTPSLPYQWFDTPNIRLFTVKDFRDLCRELNLNIEREEYVSMGADGTVRPIRRFPGQRATAALFLLARC